MLKVYTNASRIEITSSSAFESEDSNGRRAPHGMELTPFAEVAAEVASAANRRRGVPQGERRVWISLATFDEAEELATLLGDGYLATDAGEGCWPRFAVIPAYKVGDPVCYGFNGDSYPCGEIAKIGQGRRAMITTSTGKRFTRLALTGSWTEVGSKAWCLGYGHRETRNLEF